MAFIGFMHLLLHMQNFGPTALESHILSNSHDHIRQIWQTFIQESIRTVSNVLNITYETNDNLAIAELTNKAYSVLGENGGIRLSNGHTCLECTQDYKATANYVPQNNDPAALLGVDENRIVP